MIRKGLTYFLAVILTGFSFSLNAQDFEEKGQPELTFDKKVHDFGKIPQGTPASYNFEIKNTGDGTLIINEVDPSCGCTTPQKPQKPIQPGETAHIKAKYDAKDMGAFNKKIFVHSNEPFSDKKVLKIKGTVVKQAKLDNDS